MTAPELSDDLIEWAHRAGFEPIPHGEALVLSSTGDETRYIIRDGDDGWLLTRASRGRSETFNLRASSRDALERYLTHVFGQTIRDDAGFDFLMLPFSRDDVAEGYSLTELDADRFRYLSQNPTGAVVAAARGEPGSLLVLIPLSHFLHFSNEELRESYLSEAGAPLLQAGRYTR